MKHIKKFNESKRSEKSEKSIILKPDDIKSLNHNLGNGSDYDFEELEASDSHHTMVDAKGAWDGKKVKVLSIYEFGYLVLIDGEMKHLISIYEPHGCQLNSKRGLLTVYGHEEIVNLWLDNGEFNEIQTR